MRLASAVLLLFVSVVASGSAAYALGPGGAPPGGGAARSFAALATAGWQDERLGDIDPGVFALALRATVCAVRSGDIPSLPQTLTVIDYSKPSTAERLWVFDLHAHELLYKVLVAHGQGSGENEATRFSNDNDSHQSSLGLFVTERPYVGRNGYSLRLKGLDAGFNDKAYERAIVMHGAPYVSATFARQQGRLGRSWGCPALPATVAREVIDRVKGGSVLFAYANQREWLRASKYLNEDCASADA